MFRKKDKSELITVPAKVQNRARSALAMGNASTWVDQCLFLVGQSVTHHQPGDELLDEAVQAAESLLALVTEMRNMEAA